MPLTDSGITDIPLWLVSFDKTGVPVPANGFSELTEYLHSRSFSQIVLLCHGWNNTQNDAIHLYQALIASVHSNATQPPGTDLRHLLFVGVVWPSSWESDDKQGIAVETLRAGGVAEQDIIALQSSGDALDAQHAATVSQQLAPMLRDVRDQEGTGGQSDLDSEAFQASLQTFGLFKWLNVLSVYQMKDRADIIGDNGVSRLLGVLQQTAPAARMHLAGHSFGCKVLLSALCSPQFSGSVASALLLQPATSFQCFCQSVEDSHLHGGYFYVPGKIKGTLFSTFSQQDSLLHNLYHLALRRSSDQLWRVSVGEPDPPSIYCALGGYGPRRANEKLVEAIPLPGTPCNDISSTTKLYAFDGNVNNAITGHSDVTNVNVVWLLNLQLNDAG